ncbi:MAG: nucleoside hydrolase [Planctomycetota bacterium]|nr:nucleoside hydrolase [Planctomycetota bacterium]
MPQKLIIDADPGIGDAFAIALAACDPGIDLIAVTATAGCVSGAVATQNILSIIESVDPDKWPRLGGCNALRPTFPAPESSASAFSGGNTAAFFDPLRLNGNYGLGATELQFAQLHNQRDSAKLLVDLVRQNPHEICVLTLGPLSNVALASELAPDFLDLIHSLVCLGGSVGAGGDVTAAAEFNLFADPGAARTVLCSHTQKALVPLDISRNAVLTFDQFDRLNESRPDSLRWFFDELLPFSLRAHREELGLEGLPLDAVTALAAIAEPRHFSTEAMSVDVEQDGNLTRGVSVFDRRGIPRWQQNIDVLTAVDPQGVLDYLTRVLKS